MGSIGSEALEKWKSNPKMVPEGSVVFEDSVLEINVEEETKNNEFYKFIFAALAMYSGITIFF